MKLKSKWSKILIGSAMIAGPALITIPLVITFSSVKEEERRNKWDSLSLIPQSKYSPSPRIAKLFPEEKFNNIKDKIIYDFEHNSQAMRIKANSGPGIGNHRLNKKACSVQLVESNGKDEFKINKVTEYELIQDINSEYKKGNIVTKVLIRIINLTDNTDQEITMLYKNGKVDKENKPEPKPVDVQSYFDQMNSWVPPGFTPQPEPVPPVPPKPEPDVDDDYQPGEGWSEYLNRKDFNILKTNIMKDHFDLYPKGSKHNLNGVDFILNNSNIQIKFKDSKFIINQSFDFKCENAPTTADITIGQTYRAVVKISFDLFDRTKVQRLKHFIDNKLVSDSKDVATTMSEKDFSDFFKHFYYLSQPEQQPSTPETEENEKD